MSTERTWDELVEENDHAAVYGESWVPNKDPDQPSTLVATIVSYKVGPPTRYEDHPWICNVTDRDGKDWSIWLLSLQLQQEFAEQKPMPGERIVVRYGGLKEKKTQPGEFFHKYVLTVDREQQLPAFLTAPQLDPPKDAESEPVMADGLPYGEQRPKPADVPDAEIVAEDDDAIPY